MKLENLGAARWRSTSVVAEVVCVSKGAIDRGVKIRL